MSIEVEKLSVGLGKSNETGPDGSGKDASFSGRVRDGKVLENTAGQGAGGDEVRVLDISEVFKDVPAVYEKGKEVLKQKKYIKSLQVYKRKRPEHLHKAFSETRPGGEVVVSQQELPWLRKDIRVRLVEVETESGEIFRLGSVIKNANGIEHAARELSEESSRRINNMLYQGLAEKRVPKIIKDQRSKRRVMYFGNNNSERVYFVHLPDATSDEKGAGRQVPERNIPTVLLVAACHKSHQAHVLKALTNHGTKKYKLG